MSFPNEDTIIGDANVVYHRWAGAMGLPQYDQQNRYEKVYWKRKPRKRMMALYSATYFCRPELKYRTGVRLRWVRRFRGMERWDTAYNLLGHTDIGGEHYDRYKDDLLYLHYRTVGRNGRKPKKRPTVKWGKMALERLGFDVVRREEISGGVSYGA
jgi:hypothetical protein